MSITDWSLDEVRPYEAVVVHFAYPEPTSLFHTRTLRVGKALHQYRLDKIEERSGSPKIFLTDLDTGRPLVLSQPPRR